MRFVASVVLAASLCRSVAAGITAYDIPNVHMPGTSTFNAGPSVSTSLPAWQTLRAYNTTLLAAPGPPNPGLAKELSVQIPAANARPLSIPQKGNFYGLSVELSVADQVLGKNSSLLHVPFLNHLSNLHLRAGANIQIRVGGNSQENSSLIMENFGGTSSIHKFKNAATNNPTATPNIDYSIDLLYTMANISTLVPVDWYFGLAFYPTNFSNSVLVAEKAISILGNRLLALQMGNEPDLYGQGDRRRIGPYLVKDFIGEWNQALPQLHSNSIYGNQKLLLGPSTCCNLGDTWPYDTTVPEFIDAFPNDLKMVTIQRYPSANCGTDNSRSPQERLPHYLNHREIVELLAEYGTAIQRSVAASLPFIMFETNTASCGGWPGVSDAFAAALWGVDYGLQLASRNFSSALIHVGGQNVAYNPFTPAPGGSPKTYQWSTGAIYYSMLAVAEVFGASNKSQVIDLNIENELTPAYAIYEDGAPTRIALFNYANDPSGNNDYTATVRLPAGGAFPSTVSVKYMRAPSVIEKSNITWAGQTFSGFFQSDGRPRGDMVAETAQCDATAGTCAIRVPAPSFALVFLTQDALSNSSPTPEEIATATYSTTALTGKLINTATVDQAVLQTSNGNRGGSRSPSHGYGSTSWQGQQALLNAATTRGMIAWSLLVACLGAVIAGYQLSA